MTFDVSRYGPAVAAILDDGQRLADLGPGTPNLAMKSQLEGFDPFRDLGPIRDPEMAKACLAGLWLYHDFLDESHSISQEIATSTGSFWHAVMHRREPDASNSKYWWRQVGRHPILDRVRLSAVELEYEGFEPDRFVDFCERVRGTNAEGESIAKRVQLAEWRVAFEYCYANAVH